MDHFKKLSLVKKVLFIILAVFLIFILFLIIKTLKVNNKRNKVIANNQVSKIETYNLGGYDQKVLIEGKDEDSPVLIFLHGGPGTPIPFNGGMRGLMEPVTDNHILVVWDQYGCGINNNQLSDDMNVESYVEMTIDLIKEVKSQYPDNELHIFGVSWGSILAARAGEELPDLIDSVVVYGQVSRDLFFNGEVYDKLKSSDLTEEELEKLDQVFERKDKKQEDLAFVSKMLMKHTNAYFSENSFEGSGEKPDILAFVLGILTSPDYKPSHIKAIINNGFTKNQSVFDSMLEVDLTETFKNIKTPYYIIQGDQDLVTSTESIKNIVETIDNPNIDLKIYKDVGHYPNMKVIEEFMENE